MQQPPGYVKCDSNGIPFVCRLKKALCSLRQAPHASDSTLYVLVYVDDIIITGSLSTTIDWFVRLLNDEFSLKDLGALHYFLGIEVHRSSGCLHLCQRKYIRDILDRCSMTNAKSVHMLMVSSSIMFKDDGEWLKDPTEYRSLAGALQYVILTRPDIAYAVNRICQFMHNPTTTHMVTLKRILQYLCGILNFGIVVCPSARLSLVGYANANWGIDFDEYKSLAAATSEVTWLLLLRQELQLKSDDTSNVWYDNSSAIVANPILNSKFKHVELDLFFVREKVTYGSLMVGEVPSCDQVANVFTKPLSVTSFT
ncbi:hypothetical protein CXB51_035380 [Gossypium anomalum]|uniref:Reverse transcriptase Ty1/copia-type domain-containing protein n=1 Tax=Gossypium anomalum TaxID=47600 RepID=A0A8J5Y830_9ROSI|nr:hypothetical protein CXB51_035380 [Gossypium anomalum]